MKILKKSFLLATAALLALSLTGCPNPDSNGEGNSTELPSSGLKIEKVEKGSSIEKTFTIDLSENPLNEKGTNEFVVNKDVSSSVYVSFFEQATSEVTELKWTATVTAVSETSLSIKVSVKLPEKDGKAIFDINISSTCTENETSIDQYVYFDVGNVIEESQTAFTDTLTAITDLSQITEEETLYFYRKGSPYNNYRYDYYYTISKDSITKQGYIYSLSSNKYTLISKYIDTYTFKGGIIYDEDEEVVGTLNKTGDTYYIVSESLPRTSGSGLFATFGKEVEENGNTEESYISFYKDGICKLQSTYTYNGETESDEMTLAYHNDNGLISILQMSNAIYDGNSIIMLNGVLTKVDALPVIEDTSTN